MDEAGARRIEPRARTVRAALWSPTTATVDPGAVVGSLVEDAVREGIKRALRRYDVFSDSNPVPGILRALRNLHDPKNEKMKMGIYIFGDEFNGMADAVLKRVDDLNPADEHGNRKVVINAITFPTTIRFEFSMGNTGLKMANLMRELCYEHGGAFIALQDL